jgi:hypothetical protein
MYLIDFFLKNPELNNKYVDKSFSKKFVLTGN